MPYKGLNANVSEHSVCSTFIGEYPLAYEDGTVFRNVEIYNTDIGE
jgi:hypothetical protein